MRKTTQIRFLIITIIVMTIVCIPALGQQTGCCLTICHSTTQSSCAGDFRPGMLCKNVDYCTIGCCVDARAEENGFDNPVHCYNNYMKGRCVFDFYKKNCEEIDTCKKNDKQLQATESEEDIISPKIGYSGTMYKINYKLRSGTGVSITPGQSPAATTANLRKNLLKAIISYDGVEQNRMQLYDDGEHGDANKNDNIYGNIWDSESASRYAGARQYGVKIIMLDPTNSNSTSTLAVQNLSVVSGTRCFPLSIKSDEAGTPKIIFAGKGYSRIGASYFEGDVNTNKGRLLLVEPFKSAGKNINIYRFDSEISTANLAGIKSKMQTECSYDETKDMIILLDKNSETCSSGAGIIITNPQSTYQAPSSTGSVDLNTAMHQLCQFITTDSDQTRQKQEKTFGPKINLLTANDSTSSSPNISISFVATDNIDTEIKYVVGFDGETKETGVAQNNSPKTIAINGLANGIYNYLIRVTDSDGNSADSGEGRIAVDAAGGINKSFEAKILMPTSNSTIYSGSTYTIFVIKGAETNEITYTLFMDDAIKKESKAKSEEPNYVIIESISKGEHKLKIVAKSGTATTTSEEIIFKNEG